MTTSTPEESPICVLIVEDEADLREALERKFTKKGFRVHTAEGGHQGLQICLQNPIDIVLTDIRMAKGSGIELIDSIREAKLERTPVVICMSAFSDLTLEGAFLKGADAMFPKPIDSSALLAAMMHFYNQRKQRLEALRAATVASNK